MYCVSFLLVLELKRVLVVFKNVIHGISHEIFEVSVVGFL